MSPRRRDRGPDRRLDWRNPDLPILTRVLEETPMGGFRKVAVDMEPEEMSEMCQESMKFSQNPEWRRDPSYNWARPGVRRRRL